MGLNKLHKRCVMCKNFRIDLGCQLHNEFCDGKDFLPDLEQTVANLLGLLYYRADFSDELLDYIDDNLTRALKFMKD